MAHLQHAVCASRTGGHILLSCVKSPACCLAEWKCLSSRAAGVHAESTRRDLRHSHGLSSRSAGLHFFFFIHAASFACGELETRRGENDSVTMVQSCLTSGSCGFFFFSCLCTSKKWAVAPMGLKMLLLRVRYGEHLVPRPVVVFPLPSAAAHL